MQYDYDLVIVGQRPAARSALQHALQTVIRSVFPTELPRRARVAIVIDPTRATTPIAPIALSPTLSQTLGKIQNQPLNQTPSQTRSSPLNSVFGDSSAFATRAPIADHQRQAAVIAQHCDQLNSWAQFAIAGADVLLGTGQWEACTESPTRSQRSRRSSGTQSPSVLPKVQYRVMPQNQGQANVTETPNPLLHLTRRPRILRSRAYLLIPDARAASPWVLNPDSSPSAFTPIVPVGHDWDLEAWWRSLDCIPPAATVYGSTLRAQELALSLCQLGTAITWISPESSCLPWETPQTAQRWQTYLESFGITCHFNMTGLPDTFPLHIFSNLSQQPLFWVEPTVPDVPRVELEAIGVAFCGAHLQLDNQLRTTHPQIYACAAALQGEDHESIAQAEAKIAVQNALQAVHPTIHPMNLLNWQQRPTKTPQYTQIPWSMGQNYVKVGGEFAIWRSAQLHPHNPNIFNRNFIGKFKKWSGFSRFITTYLRKFSSLINQVPSKVFRLKHSHSNQQPTGQVRSLTLHLHQLPSRQLLNQLDGYLEVKLTPHYKILEITVIAPDAAQLITPLVLLIQLQNQYPDHPIHGFQAIEQLSLNKQGLDQSSAEICEWLRDAILEDKYRGQSHYLKL